MSSVPSKIFARIIFNRIKDKIEKKLIARQFGFRKQRSCIDVIYKVRIIMEQSLEQKSPLYLAFVDFAKAFDSARQQIIWNNLKQIGISNKIIIVIKETHDCHVFYVLNHGKLSETFSTLNGSDKDVYCYHYCLSWSRMV